MNKNLENSVKDGAANSVSVGAGEAFIAPYAVLRGASEAYLGWLAAIPALVGAFFQLLSPYAVKTYGYRKGLVLTGVTLNALSWLLILSTVLVSAETALPLLIVFFSVYVAANAFANPVWSGWMASLVPQNIRGTFFGRRNAVTQLASLSATLAAGFLLGFFQDGYVILGFAFLFSASFLARLASLHYLRRVDELERPAYTPVENPCQFVCKPFNHEIRNTVFLTSVFLFAVNVAAPFFVLYMLRNLHFTLLEYTFLILAAGLARVVAMPYWGRITELFGNKIVLVSCTLFASLVPLLWLFTTNFLVLAFIEIFSGFVWAGLDLSAFNYVLSSVNQERVPSTISNYNFFAGLARFLGPLAGASLIPFFDASPVLGFAGIPAVFLVSGIARLSAAAFLTASLHEERLLVPYRKRPILIRFSHLHPSRALTSSHVHGFKGGSI